MKYVININFETNYLYIKFKNKYETRGKHAIRASFNINGDTLAI